MLNLDIGGSKHRRAMKDKWKILDVFKDADYVHDLNLEEPLPFKKSSVDNIYTSHTLEHIEAENIGFILKEFHRILKPGGKCRIIVPDCEYAINLYINNPKELANERKGYYCGKPGNVPVTPMGYLTGWFHTNKKDFGTGHKIGFDEELLRAFIAETKFKNIKKMRYNECSEVFEGKDYEIYAGWSLYFEMEVYKVIKGGKYGTGKIGGGNRN